MRIDIVLGNGYGDEGKGLITDWLAGCPGSAVVRFCGGAQAGHTVVDPSGVRHVFHHIGSGTLRGAPTFLSRFVAVDPVLFCGERQELVEKGFTPVVSVDPMAPVVTPYDVLLNQMTERARGAERHGSCGCGVGEAMRRHEERPERLVVGDLDGPLLEHKLTAIERATTEVLASRGLVDLDMVEELARDLARARSMFLDAVAPFRAAVKVERYENFASTGYEVLVFEGSQGLLLDRDIGVFPHVTRAKTGLANVHALLGTDLADAQVYLVSRCYMTRHGAGPMREEMTTMVPLVNIAEETNRPNGWQGALRYGPYDGPLLDWARRRALAEVPRLLRRPKVVTTCLDQVAGAVPVVGGEPVPPTTFVAISDVVSWGPTLADVKCVR